MKRKIGENFVDDDTYIEHISSLNAELLEAVRLLLPYLSYGNESLRIKITGIIAKASPANYTGDSMRIEKEYFQMSTSDLILCYLLLFEEMAKWAKIGKHSFSHLIDDRRILMTRMKAEISRREEYETRG